MKNQPRRCEGFAKDAKKPLWFLLFRALRSSWRLRGLQLVFLVGVAACSRKPEKHATRPVAQQQEEATPKADKAIAEASDDADTTWLSGTWQESDRQHWFLFNLPNEVAELSGKPARVVRRGKLSVNGRYVDAIFPAGEVHFVATKDHAEMTSDAPRGTYRRGAPP